MGNDNARSDAGVAALAAWTCDLVAGVPTPTEHDRIGWFGPDELQALPWAPADIPLVHAMVALLRR